MRKIDQYDLEAEREGNALKNGNHIKAKGKRILKNRRAMNTGNRVIQTRIERRHTNA